jgi:hypothetical protein
MIVLYDPYWDYLVLYYYDEQGYFVSDVEGLNCNFNVYTAPLPPLKIRSLFKSHIIHDDLEV